jgi:hypothetical protein
VKIREQHNATRVRLRASLLLAGAAILLLGHAIGSSGSGAPAAPDASVGAAAGRSRTKAPRTLPPEPGSARLGSAQAEAAPAQPAAGSGFSPADGPGESAPQPPDPLQTWTNRDPVPQGARFDPQDLRALADLIEANRLSESSSSTDYDDGDGVLEPLEVGRQVWRAGRLIGLFMGQDRYGSFDYGLEVVPASLGDLGALEALDLSTNRLTALPDSVGELGRLETLRVQRNALVALPDSIGNLGALRELVVGENALHTLPDSIADDAALEEIHVNDNPLHTLPEGIGALSRLRVLNVSHGAAVDPARVSVARANPPGPGGAGQEGLVALPASMAALPALETLHLAGNRLFCAGGTADPSLAPARLRDGSIPRLHGLLLQHCSFGSTP